MIENTQLVGVRGLRGPSVQSIDCSERKWGLWRLTPGSHGKAASEQESLQCLVAPKKVGPYHVV